MGIFCFDFDPSSKYGVAKASLKLKQLKLPVGAVCGRCKEVLEWKKKYDKYKPLTAPGRWSVAANSIVPFFFFFVIISSSLLDFVLLPAPC